MPAEEKFVNKLGEIPVVQDGWNAALGYYTRVKDYNNLTKLTLSAAENSLKKASEMSTPVLNRYQPQIDVMNTFACNKLEDIEAKYPLLKQPTDEVKEACVEYVQPIVDKVKPYVTYVNGMVDSTQKTVNQIKTSSTNLVTGARYLGVNTIGQAMVLTLETPPGRLMTSTINYALVHTDSLIDKYIPEEEEEEHDSERESDEEDDAGTESQQGQEEMEQMEEMAPTPARLAIQLNHLSTKLRRRLHQRAHRDFKLAKTRTLTAVLQLRQTLDLSNYAKINLVGAYSKAQEIWSEILQSEDESAEADYAKSNETYAQALEKKIITMGRLITRQVRSGVSALEKAAAEAGLFVKDPISKSREYRDFIYQFSSDNFSNTLEKAHENLSAFQKKLQNMLDNLEAPDWLGVDIDMNGIDLAEEEEEGLDGQVIDPSIEVVPVNHV